MADKYIGLQYPLVKTVRGILAQKINIDLIKADMLQLLLTNPGERVMLPDYGTPLRRLIFEQNDDILKQQARQMIINSLEKWEPRIIVNNVVVGSVEKSDLDRLDTREEMDKILKITINFYDPNDISELNELRLEVPLGGA